jgi:hypothetical protein
MYKKAQLCNKRFVIFLVSNWVKRFRTEELIKEDLHVRIWG